MDQVMLPQLTCERAVLDVLQSCTAKGSGVVLEA